MTKKIKWRLAERPTPTEVKDLMVIGILTKEEAREILFSEEEDEGSRDKKSLESEIKFLRELVQKLSNGQRTEIVKVFQDVYIPYVKQPWIAPYQFYCGIGTAATGGLTSAANANYSMTSGGSSVSYNYDTTPGDFTTVKTF